MARFTTGAEAIRQAAESRGGGMKDFAPQITWRGGDTKYIQFITPLEEIPTVEMYQYIKVGYMPSGDPMFRTFISPRDPALLATNPDAKDYLRERGLFPRRRQVALVAELDPITETKNGRTKPVGFKLQQRVYKREDGDLTLPALGVVIQSHIFFGWFATFAEDHDVEDHVFKVIRHGQDQNTTYDAFEVGKAIDLGLKKDEYPIDFDQYLDELSSEERMRMYVEDKPADWEFDRFANRGKKQPRRQEVVEEVDEVEEPTPRRSRRFAALEDRVTEK